MSNMMSKAEKPKFSVAIQTAGYQKLINNTLGDPNRARRFVAAISSAVAVNPALQECEAGTILSGALLGESLNLSPSPQLGQYYLVPYKMKEKRDKQGNVIEPEKQCAQFQLGYKGYIQLAIRSGQYRKLNVLPVKEGELMRFNPLLEEIEINLIDDEVKREKAETIGYYAMFEYMNGFRKAIYWSKAKMEAHADNYSKAFSLEDYRKLTAGKIPEKDKWKYSSFWYKNFDDMACKTMLRQLISKWGVMSIDLQDAYAKDMGVIDVDGNVSYVEAESEEEMKTEPVEAEVVQQEVLADEPKEVSLSDL